MKDPNKTSTLFEVLSDGSANFIYFKYYYFKMYENVW